MFGGVEWADYIWWSGNTLAVQDCSIFILGQFRQPTTYQGRPRSMFAYIPYIYMETSKGLKHNCVKRVSLCKEVPWSIRDVYILYTTVRVWDHETIWVRMYSNHPSSGSIPTAIPIAQKPPGHCIILCSYIGASSWTGGPKASPVDLRVEF